MHANPFSTRHKFRLIVWLVPTVGLVVLLAVEYSEDGKKQIDDVKVKRNSCSNLFLNMIVAHYELGINQDIPTKDKRCYRSVDELGSAIVGKEGCYESKEDEDP